MTETNFSDTTGSASDSDGGSNASDNASNSNASMGNVSLSDSSDWNDDLNSDDASQIAVFGSSGRVTVSGELDFDSADRFREAMAQAASLDEPQLVLDMSQVSFMDSSGLRELATMRSAGYQITIENASECVRTLLRVTRMDEVFTLA